jgi:hypothetical protein
MECLTFIPVEDQGIEYLRTSERTPRRLPRQ